MKGKTSQMSPNSTCTPLAHDLFVSVARIDSWHSFLDWFRKSKRKLSQQISVSSFEMQCGWVHNVPACLTPIMYPHRLHARYDPVAMKCFTGGTINSVFSVNSYGPWTIKSLTPNLFSLAATASFIVEIYWSFIASENTSLNTCINSSKCWSFSFLLSWERDLLWFIGCCSWESYKNFFSF